MKKFILFTWVLLPTVLQAQVAPVYLDIDSPQTGNKVFVASDYISFKPGFHFKATDNDSLHAYIFKGTQDYALASYQTYVDPTTTPIDKNLPVGSLPGSFNVSGSGAANYTIPLELPHAAVELMPSLSLQYNSQAGNGVLGLGWALQGLSSITKANKNNYYDGVRGGIKGLDDDAISIDGQRLINIQGNNFAVGTVYATEQEDYIRITKTNEGFLAILKNGTRIEYGYTEDSRLLGSEVETMELGWLANKVIDLYGNYYTIHYKNFGNGEVVPDYITYSKNTETNAITAVNQVRFSYMDKLDKSNNYINAKEFKHTKLLSSILILNNGKPYRKYRLSYFFDQYSKLNKIELEGVNGITYNPTLIGWNPVDFDSYNMAGAYKSSTFNYFNHGDYNGDGKTDLLKIERKDSYTVNDKWEVYLNDLDYRRNFAKYAFNNNIETTNSLTPFFHQFLKQQTYLGSIDVDVNNNGSSDLLLIENKDTLGENSITHSTITPLLSKYDVITGHLEFDEFPAFPPITFENWEHTTFKLADFDGDGVVDFFRIRKPTKTGSITTDNVEVYFYHQSVEKINLQINLNHDSKIEIGDYNGDGKSDIFLFFKDQLKVYEFDVQNNLFVPVTIPLTQESVDIEHSFFLADFNGDGNTDVLQLMHNGLKKDSPFLGDTYCKPYINYEDHIIYLSTQSGFVVSTDYELTFKTQENNQRIYLEHLYLLDLNGDGRTDIFQQMITPGCYQGVPSTIKSSHMQFNLPSNVVAKNYTTEIPLFDRTLTTFGDFDGDGKLDAFYFEDQNDKNADIFFFHSNEPENLVVDIRNGMGSSLTFEYASLTEDYKAYKQYNDFGFRPPLFVVHNLYNSAFGSEPAITYTYTEAMFNFSGKGFLGFSNLLTQDWQLGTMVEQANKLQTEYQFLYPQTTYHYVYDVDENEYLGLSTSIHKFKPIVSLGSKRFQFQLDELTDHNLVDASIETSKFTYDTDGNITTLLKNTAVGSNGSFLFSETINNTYTKLGNSTFDNALDWQTITTQYKEEPEVTITTDFEYKSNFLLDFKTINPGTDREITTTYYYHPINKRPIKSKVSTNEIDPNGQVYADRESAELVFDNSYRYVKSMINSLGHTASISWNTDLGLPSSVVNPNERASSTKYNGFGQKISETDPFGNEISYRLHWNTNSQYPEAVFYSEVKKKNFPTTRSYINKFGQPFITEQETVNGVVIKQRVDYRVNGTVEKSYLPYSGDTSGLFTQYFYDPYFRKAKNLGANGVNVYHQYSLNSQAGLFATEIKKTITDIPDNTPPELEGINFTTKHHSTWVNSFGRPIQAKDHLGNETKYTYNSFGQTKTLENFDNIVAMQYDELGQQRSLTDPNTGTTSYEYNVFGELKTQTTVDGKTTKLFYDQLGRIIRKEESSSGRVIRYEYDAPNALGMLSLETDGAGNEISYIYEEGQLISTTEKIKNEAYTNIYAYNQQGQVISRTYPSGFIVGYVYDNKGFLIRLMNNMNQNVIWELNEVNDFGQITRSQYGNGVVNQKTYDVFGALQAITAGNNQNLNNILHQKYKFKKITGNLSWREDALRGKKEIFRYDDLDRLTEIKNTNNDVLLSMNYLPNGNITNKSDIGSYSYENNNKPHALTGINTHLDITNATVLRDQTAEYNHNQDVSWIKEVVLEEGEYEQTFEYNTAYRRNYTKLTLNGSTIHEKTYLGDYELITDALGVTKAYHYISTPSGLVSVYVQESDGTGSMLYTHQDYLGSIMAITDETGLLLQEYSYDAWGRTRRPDNHSYDNIETPLLDRGYTLHEHLPVFGLIHMNGRLYDPLVGRMLSIDNNIQSPGNSQNFNRYSYVLNNPLKYTDPSGESFAAIATFIAIGSYQLLSGTYEGWEQSGKKAVIAGLSAGLGSIVSVGVAGAFAPGANPITVGVVSGAAGGAVAGFAGGFATAYGYSNPWQAGIKGAIIGGITGGILGGISGGFKNLGEGMNFWGTHPSTRGLSADLWRYDVSSRELNYVSDFGGSDVNIFDIGVYTDAGTAFEHYTFQVVKVLEASETFKFWESAFSGSSGASGGLIGAQSGGSLPEVDIYTAEFSVNFAILGGINFSIGVGRTKTGGYFGYRTFGPSIGVDASVGFSVTGYYSLNDRQISIQNLRGDGAEYELGIGPIDAVSGGDLSRSFGPFGTIREPGINNFKTESIGLSLGSPFGFTYKAFTTNVFNF